MRKTPIITIVLLSLLLGACASSNSGGVYTREEARKVQTVKTGVIEGIRQVKLEGTKTPIGTVAGGAVGGIAGGSVGDSRTSSVVAVVGAVAGAIAGSAIEEIATRKDGVELTVKLDGGALIAIVQEADEEFHPGEKVRILEHGGTTRVSH